jgi:DNA-binding transcriptional ArsR family regulator
VSRVLVTNSDIIALARGKDYDKVVYVVLVVGEKGYDDVLKDHKAFIDVCKNAGINLELEVIRADGLGEKPFRAMLSALWKHYVEHDEVDVYITQGDQLVSTTLLVLATLSLPVNAKRVRLIAEDTDFRVELDVNKYARLLALDEVEKKIVWYLQTRGDAKLSEVVRALGKSKATVYRRLKRLEELSLVKTTETYTYRAEKLVDVYAIV